MITFREYLSETPFAEYGNYVSEDGEDLTGTKINKQKYKFVEDLEFENNKISLYENNREYLITQKDSEIIIFNMKFSNYNKLENTIQIKYIFTLEKFRTKGLSSIIYKFLVLNKKFIILSDGQQYLGARKLWARLSKDDNLTIDLIDYSTGKILEQNIKLEHGKTNNDFDLKYYTNNYNKMNNYINLRFLLRERHA